MKKTLVHILNGLVIFAMLLQSLGSTSFDSGVTHAKAEVDLTSQRNRGVAVNEATPEIPPTATETKPPEPPRTTPTETSTATPEFPYPPPGNTPTPEPPVPTDIPTDRPTPELPVPTDPISDTLPGKEQFDIPIKGGEAVAMGGTVKVIIPAGAIAEDIILQIGAPTEDITPKISLSGNLFEITATGKDSKSAITQFMQPITIAVSYDSLQWGKRAADLCLFYYDEKLGTWQTMSSTVDTKTYWISTQSDHLTLFDIDVNNWQAATLPDLKGFQVANFTGAASYSMSFQVPPGPGGLQPGLSLSYNSQTVDGANLQNQASWVGMGWSLDTGAITRNMNGTNDYLEDDTFSIVANGVGGMLLPVNDSSVPEHVRAYHTADESFWRVWAYLDPDPNNEIIVSWKAWDKSGTEYVFGDRSDTSGDERGQFPWCGQEADADDYQYWNFPLVTVRNIFDKELNYYYTQEAKNTHCPGSFGDRDTTLAVYPSEIRYPNNLYRVRFVKSASDRFDYNTGWTDENARTLFKRSKLNELLIEHDFDQNGFENSADELVRKYVFSYVGGTYVGSGSCPAGVIYPNHKWDGSNGCTLTLVSVTEYGKEGTSSLPATTFTYDGLHLDTGSNGYGGQVEYDYETTPWSEIDNDDDYEQKQVFNAQTNLCGSGTPRGWYQYPTGDRLGCDLYKMTVEGKAYHKLPALMIQPGSSYQLYVKIKNDESGTTASLGIDYYNGETTIVTQDLSDGAWHEVRAMLVIPAETNQVWMYIECDGCKIQEFDLTLLPTRYRVSDKKIYATTGATPITTHYTFDEAATNDEVHSYAVQQSEAPGGDPGRLNTPKWTDARGHATVREVSPSGAVTTSWYHQGDYRKGQSNGSVVMLQDVWEPFEVSGWGSLSGWSYTGSQPIVERVTGDQALKNLASSSENSLWRTNASVSDGETVLAQFRINGTLTSAESAIALEGPDANWRWGVKVRPNGSNSELVVQYRAGSGDSWHYPATLSGNFQVNVWYIVMLTVDDDGFLVRAWQREEPSVYVQYECRIDTNCPKNSFAGKTWRFKQISLNSTTWLDEYVEGKVYSLSFTAITANATLFTPDPMPHPEHKSGYIDLAIVWNYPSWQVGMTFENGAEWLGTKNENQYLTSDQGGSQSGTQYGNQTRSISSSGSNSGWTPYRASLTNYYPYSSETRYLVGLAARATQYKCPGGACDFDDADRIGVVQYLYDDRLYYNFQPSDGKLKKQRTVLYFANGSPTEPRFSDTAYEYDSWGNRTIVTAYTGEGTWSNIGQGTAQTSTTIYDDSTYHTYAVEERNALYSQGFPATFITYDYSFGLPLTVQGPNGALTKVYAQYDTFGRMRKVWKPGDYDPNNPPPGGSSTPTIELQYYDTGSPYFYTTATQRIDSSTTFTVRKFYDGLGRLLQTQSAGVVLSDGACSDAAHNPDICDVVVDTYYDSAGRTWKQSIPYAVSQGSGYRTPQSQPYTETLYDSLGRTQTVKDTAGQTSATYSYGLLQTTVTDALSNATTKMNDVWGRTTAVHPTLEPWTRYTYDEADRLVKVEQMNGVTALTGFTINLSYDMVGRKTTMDDPDMGMWYYAYDATGNLFRQSDARGQRICLYYDVINRLTGKHYRSDDSCPTSNPSLNISYTYDQGTNGIGMRTAMTDGSGSASWLYDTRGLMVKETKVVSSIGTFVTEWSYNSADLVTWMKYPADASGNQGEQVSYTYHTQKAIDSVSGTSTYVEATTYDAAGRVDVRTLGSSVLKTDYDYFDWGTVNGLGKLKQIKTGTTANPTSLLDLRYYDTQSGATWYDGAGNLSQIADYKNGNPQTQYFTYDELNRLITAYAAGGTSGSGDYGSSQSPESYTYSTSSGNLSSKAGVSYTYNAQVTCTAGTRTIPHAVSSAGSNDYTYDCNGNMTLREVGSDTYRQSYDAENQLVKVEHQETGGSWTVIAEFIYDGDGKRINRIVNSTTTTYIGNYLEWTGSTSTMKKYYYAGSIRVAIRTGSSTLYWMFGDHLGSMTLTAYSGGNRRDIVLYKPWGETRFSYYPSGSLPTTFKFTGQRQESSLGGTEGLYYYGARWYDPALGRFIQPDTIIPPGQGVQAFDRYSYVNNSPINYTDTSGHWLETLWDVSSVFLDVVDIYQNGLTWENGAALVIDVACVILPAVPAVGSVILKTSKAANTIDNAVDAARVADDIIDATGQLHHVFSNKVMDALNGHDILKGIFNRDDFIVQAADAASHNGYQEWHIAYDDEIVEWLTSHDKATSEEFLNYMLELYNRTDMQNRFPDAYKLIEMALAEMK